MKKFLLSVSAIALCASAIYGTSVLAAAPQKVTQLGKAVTTAVPGKAFAMKFQVKNTGETAYSGVKVIFHIPGDITYSSVSPANGLLDDTTVSWSNVPLESGQSFYPSFTFKVDNGTPIKTKMNIWVEVTGEDMESTSTNFSITTVPAAKVKVVTLTPPEMSALFQTIYGRTATDSELKYWLSRRADKPLKAALAGAMAYHKTLGLTH